MSAISPLKLSLEGGWSNRTVWVLYSRRSCTVGGTYYLFLSVREEILFYPVSGNEWDMKYLLPTATFSLSVSLSHSLSYSPFNLITRRRPPLSTIHTTTTTALKGSKYKGKKSLPRQNDCHPSLYTPPPHTGLLFCRYNSSNSSNEEE